MGDEADPAPDLPPSHAALAEEILHAQQRIEALAGTLEERAQMHRQVRRVIALSRHDVEAARAALRSLRLP